MKYIPIKASELRRPYGTGRILVKMSFSRSTVRNMDAANLGDGNQSAFVEFSTRLFLALLNDNLDERESREIRFLISKIADKTGYEKVIENVGKIFGV